MCAVPVIIPAIDLKDGKCVRLKQGRMEDDTVFSDDPVSKRVGAEQKVFPMIIDFVYDSLVCVLPR